MKLSELTASKVNDEEKHLDSFDKYMPRNEDTPTVFVNVLLEDISMRKKEEDSTHARKGSF